MMKRLIIASNNQGKIREFKRMIGSYFDEVLSLKDAGIKADVVEDGTTFYENARKKALEISLLTDAYVMSDDSGLSVDCLDGAPGVYSARFSGEGATDEKNNALLIEKVSAFPEDKRTARYICDLVLAKEGKELLHCEGKCDGVIILEPRGENGFGYDPYFFYPPLGRTFAEIDMDLKNTLSHRGLALIELEKMIGEAIDG